MGKWISISMITIVIAAGTLAATEPDAKELAQKGYNLFKDVLAGDEAKLPEAIRYMEEARAADETYAPNLFNLARAYFFDGITFNNEQAIGKAEKTFARIVELDPNRTDAMAFHGAILAQMSRGQDIPLFMRGAEMLRTALQKTPADLTVRIVVSFVTQSVPPEARGFIGVKDPVADLKFIGNVLGSFDSDYAPHANVVMNAFIGESLLAAGDKESARASFEKALAVSQPHDSGSLAGRKLLDKTITDRMNGGGKSILADPLFSGCHSCHLAAPDKLLGRK